MKCFVTPVITGALEILSKRLKNLETIPGKYSILYVQKTAALGTLHIRKVLQSKM